MADRQISEHQTLLRIYKLCSRAVMAMELDLSGLRVLTEAATGPFATTAVLAALAGANVRAVARDSRFGSAQEAIRQVHVLAEHAGVSDKISFSTALPAEVASDCDIVTNLGVIRPINRTIVSRLSNVAAVALMWEPWEFRPDEIDCDALEDHGVALVATNEHHPQVLTFAYLGPTVGRLLLDCGIEIVNSQILVIGSDPFGANIAQWLRESGAQVYSELSKTGSARSLDAVVLAEQRYRVTGLTDEQAFLNLCAESGTPIVHLCGGIDAAKFKAAGIAVYPPNEVMPGVMTVTTAYAGPRPVIDLHAAGLRAATDVVRARQAGASIKAAIARAAANGYGLEVNTRTSWPKINL